MDFSSRFLNINLQSSSLFKVIGYSRVLPWGVNLTEVVGLEHDTGIIWFYDWGILWLIAFYDCFPNSHSQVPLSILFFDLILWLGWLDFMTIFLQIWGGNAIFLVFNYSCLRQFQLIMLAMLSEICQTRGNLPFQLMMLANANKYQHHLGHILPLNQKIP